MKVVILAGGFGSRICEESYLKPKPMIEIGGQPILWHIMKFYSYYGHNEFVICAGYKQHVIKEYFADYYLYRSDVTFDFKKDNQIIIHNNAVEPWKVTIVDTGYNTMTGGRVKRVQKHIGDEPFLLTYGDGVCDVDLNRLTDFHRRSGNTVTLTAIHLAGRFGALDIGDNGGINNFREKAPEDSGWINGGFMVAEPGLFELIADDSVTLERYPLETLADEGKLGAYRHEGFWQCMDTMRDKELLEKLWADGEAKWKVW